MLYGMTEKITVSGVSGNVRITLEKDIEFKFDFNIVSGDFNCEIPVYSQGGRSDRTGYTDTNADLDIDVNTVSGDLNIRN
jgi:predicted membrane protein